MTKRTYVCNVCRMETGDPESIVGFYFSAAATGGSKWEQRRSSEVENHICYPCLRNASALAKEVVAPGKSAKADAIK